MTMQHGVLTVGTLEHAELQRLISVVAALGDFTTCLLAIRWGPQDAQLLGTVAGVPLSADAVLASLDSTTARPHLVDRGWISPVFVGGDLVGAVLLEGDTGRDIASVAEDLTAAVADVLSSPAAGVDTASALRALVDVSEQIHSMEVDTDTEAVLELIVQHAHELIHADITFIALANHVRNESKVTVARGARTASFRNLSVALGQGITGLALSAMEVVTLDDEDHCDTRIPAHVQSCLRDEGIVSLACSPMFHQGELTGNLLVGFRRRASMPRDAQYLLGALSGQAATAIANSRLYASLRKTNDRLERHAALSRKLSEASLAGGGREAIAAQVAIAAGCDVVVEYLCDDASAWRYLSDGGPPQPIAGSISAAKRLLQVPIQVGGELLGHVRLGDDAVCVDEFHRAALGAGAVAIALELLKEHTALQAEWRLRGELLEEMIQAGNEWSDSLRTRAVHAGIDVESPRVLALIEILPGADRSAAFAMFRAAGTAAGILVSRRGELLLVAISQHRHREEWLRSMFGRAHTRGIALRAGMSAIHTDLKRAFREASGALKLAQKGGREDVIIAAEQLGPLRFLMDAPDTAEMHCMVRTTLGPLVKHDRDRRSDLLGTVRVFLDAGGSHTLTAARCNVHLNTVKYRITKAAEVLDRDMAAPTTRFELSLAFAVLDVLDAIGISAFASVE